MCPVLHAISHFYYASPRSLPESASPAVRRLKGGSVVAAGDVASWQTTKRPVGSRGRLWPGRSRWQRQLPPLKKREKGGGLEDRARGVGRSKRKGGGQKERREDHQGQPPPAFLLLTCQGRKASSLSQPSLRSLRPRRLQTPRRDLGVFRHRTSAAAAGKRHVRARSHSVPLGVTQHLTRPPGSRDLRG